MEGDDQRRRQLEQSNYHRGYPPNYGFQGGNAPNPQHLGAIQGGHSPDRFGQGQVLTARPTVPTSMATVAGVSQELGNFAFPQGQAYQAAQMQPPTLHYQSANMQDPQRQRFPQYPPQMMYNVPQQPQATSHYDPAAQFQPRQTAAVEILSNQFGVQPQYYSASDASTPSVSATMPQGYQTPAYQQSTQYNTPSALGRSTLVSSYPTATPEFGQSISSETPGDAEPEADVAAENNDRFYRAIGETNNNTYRGMLVQAGSSLMQISNWLLSNAVSLGFTSDDQAMHAQRLALWDDFNHCWLALLQRQLDDTQRMLETGQSPTMPQSLLPVETLERMGNDLVAYCDDLGKVGLVDYQMGVAEEDIIYILNRCIDLLQPSEGEIPPAVGTVAGPSNQGRSNR